MSSPGVRPRRRAPADATPGPAAAQRELQSLADDLVVAEPDEEVDVTASVGGEAMEEEAGEEVVLLPRV